MTEEQRNKKCKKLYWKDALQAVARKEQRREVQNRHWARLFAKAQADLQKEEAVVFLGEEQLNLIQPNTETISRSTRPPLAVLAGAAAALAVSLAGYARSYRNIADGMR